MLHLWGGYQWSNRIHKNPESSILQINQQSIEVNQPGFRFQDRIEEGPKADRSNHLASSGGGGFIEVCDAMLHREIDIDR